ncbi:MAG: LytR C-terminal domain-containing protein [Candidatus Moraniibacteriota bacterium]
MPKIKKEIKISKEKEQALEKMWKVTTQETVVAKPKRKVAVKKQNKALVEEIAQIQMQAVQAEPDFVVVPEPKTEIEHLPMSIAEEAQFRSEQKTEEDNGKFGLKFDFDLNEQLAKIPRVVFAVGLVVIVVVLATFGYIYRFNKQVVVEQEKAKSLQEVKNRIGIFMELPTDEEPVFATVTDVEKIKEQKFFAKAQNGDIVLIYAKNKKALLYRWASNKVIEFSNVAGLENDKEVADDSKATEETATSEATQETQEQSTLENASQTTITPDASTAPTENQAQVATEVKREVKVVVLNGTTQKGLAQKIAGEIAQVAGVAIAKVGNANGSFEKTVVVDLSGNNSSLATEIAGKLGGEVGGELPAGETTFSGDIIVIAGKQ